MDGRVRRVASNLALLFGTLIVTAGVAEVATRLFADVPIPLLTRHPLVGSTFLPGYRGSPYNDESEREILLRINEEGFRGPDLPHEPAEGTIRIAVLGDSFTAALACEEEETAVVQLQRLLEKSHPRNRWEVMNFGVSASSTGQELALYRHLVADYRPDLVIAAFYVGNDFADNSGSLSSSPRRVYFRLAEEGGLEQLPIAARRGRASVWLNRHSRFYVWQKEATRALRDHGPVAQAYVTEPSPVLDGAWELSARIITTLADEVGRNGGRFALVVLPAGAQIYEDVWRERAAEAEDVRGLSIDPDHPDRRLTAIASRNDIPLLTLTREFRAAAPRPATETASQDLLFFRGYGHFTPRGNALAAEAIHTFLTVGTGRDLLSDRLGDATER